MGLMNGRPGVYGPVQPFTATRRYSPFYHLLSHLPLLPAGDRNCVPFAGPRWQRYQRSRQWLSVVQQPATITGLDDDIVDSVSKRQAVNSHLRQIVKCFFLGRPAPQEIRGLGRASVAKQGVDCVP